MEPGFDLILEPAGERIEAASEESNGTAETLQITWLGTGCYQIQLGDGAILTDPFVSHQGLFYSVLGGKLKVDEKKVCRTFGPLACAGRVGSGVFLGGWMCLFVSYDSPPNQHRNA